MDDIHGLPMSKNEIALENEIDRLTALNAELLAACEEAMLEFNDGYTAEGKGIIVEAMASAKESEGER